VERILGDFHGVLAFLADFKDVVSSAAVGNCVLVTVALVCTCFLVVCGVLIVREYSLAAGFAETRCRLRNITYFRHEVHCMFCAGLRDKSKGRPTAHWFVLLR